MTKNNLPRVKNFTDALSMYREATYHLNQFKAYGIGLDDDGCLVFDFEKIAYIKEEVDKISWGFGLELTSALALQLAVYQEDINDYLTEDNLERINRFFEVKVTRELINVLGSKYI